MSSVMVLSLGSLYSRNNCHGSLRLVAYSLSLHPVLRVCISVSCIRWIMCGGEHFCESGNVYHYCCGICALLCVCLFMLACSSFKLAV